MKARMCENCIKYKTIYCPNSDKCFARKDKLFYEDKYTMLARNEALEGVLKDYKHENQQFKIQISAREEEYKKLEDNWNKLKEWLKEKDNYGFEKLYLEDIVYKIAELERGVSDEIK